MDKNMVSFKATINGLVLVVGGECDFTELVGHIDKKLESSGKFFKGASLDVKYRGRKFSAEQEQIIARLLSSRTNAEIKSFKEDTVQMTSEKKDSLEPQKKFRVRRIFFKGIEEGITKFHRGTVRSGQLISFEGNLVIIGDVNPGGEVLAAGNVIVMGALRGMVHAGSDGNREAVVAALNLQPTQLRIADVITRPPDTKEDKHSLIPELAYVRDGLVYIDRFLPQFK